MSKPLELTVYEIDDETGRYIDPHGYTYAHEDVEQFGEWKRLTEAELAAEYHAAEVEAWRDSAIYRQSAHSAALEHQAATLYRFATSPHYFEDAA